MWLASQRHALRACLQGDLLQSRNQSVHLFLDGTWLRDTAAPVWARVFATLPPKRRLVKKTNLSKLRLEGQLRKLRGGRADCPNHLLPIFFFLLEVSS